jgi:hypothetical protein
MIGSRRTAAMSAVMASSESPAFSASASQRSSEWRSVLLASAEIDDSAGVPVMKVPWPGRPAASPSYSSCR